jgi:hypothetical protein
VNGGGTSYIIAGGGDVTVTAGAVDISGTGALSLGTISAAGKDVNLTAGGGVTQSGAITTGTLTLSGSVNFTLNNTGNNITTLATGATNPASIRYTDTNEFAVGTVNATTSVTLTAGGDVTQSGAITTGTLTLRGATTFTLNNTGNNITTLATAVTNPTSVSYTDSNALILGSINTGALTITAGGAVTQAASTAITTTGTLTLSGATTFTLNNTGNDIGTLATGATNPASVSYTDTNGFAVGTVNATTSVTLTAGGDVTQSGGIITSTGAVSVTATGKIELTGANAISGTFTGSATSGNVSLTNTGTLAIQGITAATGNNITVENTGNINVTTSAITTGSGTGDISLTAAGGTLTVGEVLSAGSGTVSLKTTTSGDIAVNQGITTTGAVTLESAGNISEDTTNGKILTATAVTATSAGGVTLNGANTINGTFAGSAGTSGAVSLINTGTLEIRGITTQSTYGITVNNTGAINVTTSAITTGSGAGNISLTAAGGTLTVGAALSAGSGNITITTTGDTSHITANGTITSSGDIILKTETGTASTGANITINGTISTPNTLSLITAHPGTGVVTLNADITVEGVGAGLGADGTNGNSLYIYAASVSRTVGAAAVTYGDIYLYLDDLSPDANVMSNMTLAAGYSIYLLPRTANDIIFYTENSGPPSGGNLPNSNVSYIKTSSVWGSVALKTQGDKSIFIVNAVVSNLTTLTLDTTGDGFIEFYQDPGYSSNNSYTSAGTILTLKPGTGGVQTYHSSSSGTTAIILGASSFAVPSSVPFTILQGHASIPAAGITLGGKVASPSAGNLTLTAGTGNISVSGEAGTSSEPLGGLTVVSAAGVTFASTVTAASFTQSAGTGTTAFNGAQTYTAGFSFTGTNLTVSSALQTDTDTTGDGPFSFTGAALTLNGALTTTANAGNTVTINNTGLFTTSAVISAGGAFSQSGGGTNSIGADITTANTAPSDASISFAGSVELTAGVSMSTPVLTGGDITLSAGVTGTGQALTLTAGSGSITVSGAAGAFGSALGALTVNSTGSTTFSGAVYAASFTKDTGSVTTGTVIFNGLQDYSGNFEFNGAALTLHASLTAGGAVTVVNSGAFTTSTSAAISAGGAFSQSGGGTNSIGANITTTNTTTPADASISFAGSVQLTAGVSMNTFAGNGSITLSANVTQDGTAHALTLTAGTGNITVSGAAGANGAPLGNLTVDSAADATFSLAVYAGAITITSADNVTFGTAVGHTVTAASFTQSAGTGTTTFNGAQSYAAGFSFTGATLAVNNTLNCTIITITNPTTVTFSAAAVVTAASFTQTGTGSTAFGAAQTYTAGFSFTGTDLAVNSDLLTDTDNTPAPGDGAVTITATGTPGFTVGASGGILPGGSGGTLTIDSKTVNDGSIVAGPVAAGNNAIIFEKDYSGTGSITGNTSTDPNIVFRGQVSLARPTGGSIIPNGDWFVFSMNKPGTPDKQRVTIPAGVNPRLINLGHVVIERPQSATLEDNIVEIEYNSAEGPITILQQSDSALEIKNSGVLDLNYNTWTVGSAAGTGAFNGGNNGSLKFYSAKTELIVRGNMALDGAFTVDVDSTFSSGADSAGFETLLNNVRSNTYGSVVEQLPRLTVTGNVTVNTGVTFTAATKNMFLNIKKDTQPSAPSSHTIRAVVPIGGLAISNYDSIAGANETLGTLRVLSALTVQGNVYIGRKKILDAGLNTENGSGSIFLPSPNSTNISYTSYIKTAGSWVNERGSQAADNGKFERQQSRVHFTGDNIYIIGSTEWYIFDYTITAADTASGEKNIYFSSYGQPSGSDYTSIANSGNPDIHAFYSAFRVNGKRINTSDYPTVNNVDAVTLNRWPNPRTAYSPVSPSDPIINIGDWEKPGNREQFWDFSLILGARMDINYARLYYSHAVRRVPIPWYPEVLSEAENRIVFASPYYSVNPDPPYRDWRGDSHFNINWILWDRFFYSYSEDSNRNGRIDRIRLQAAFELIPPLSAFDEFEMEVQGYTIDKEKPGTRNGYQRAGNTLTTADSIYVWLVEKDYSDTGELVEWEIIKNNSLYENVTGSMKIGMPGQEGSKGKTTDTVPPRINYALTLPQHNQIFVQFSEPIDTAGVTFNVRGATVAASSYALNESEYLLPLASPYTVAELASGARLFSVDNVVDKALRAFDINLSFPDNPQFPPPNYPQDWSYSDYSPVRGQNPSPVYPYPSVFIPGNRQDLNNPDSPRVPGSGNRLIDKNVSDPSSLPPAPYTISHRVTDILVSQPPVSASDLTWFIWPVWARDNPTVVTTNSGDFHLPSLDEFGLIWEFTGKGLAGKNVLQHRDIEMQVRRNETLRNAAPNKPLLYYANVADRDKAGEKNGPRELWLPYFNMADFSNIVPFPLKPSSGYTESNDAATTRITDDLFNIKLFKTNYQNRKMLEFVFRMEGYPTAAGGVLYAARLDIAKGSAVPSNWYRLVKPFRIDVADTIQQRSGVTILNNVIDPTKGEKTYVNYMTARSGRVTIQVFTMDGTLVKVLRRENRNAGEYREAWDGTNLGGRAVARGMYFIRVVAPDIDEIRKVLVVK